MWIFDNLRAENICIKTDEYCTLSFVLKNALDKHIYVLPVMNFSI